MKKALSLFILSSVALAGLSSCNVMEDPQLQTEQKGLHSAFFDGKVTELIDETGTKGLSLVAMPDWRNTAEANIHLFENGKEGENPAMVIDPNSNYRIAHFSATFEGGEDGPYVYNGIIAPSDDSGVFVVPAEQSPDTEVSLIDPNADFLIGCSKESEASSSEKPVDMTFIRPVSLSRLAIVGLGKNEKVKEVTFTADKPLTGKFTTEDVNFEKGTVEFDKTDGKYTVTLKYNDADPKVIFYAYFVICPVEDATITSIVVDTDKNTYTKECSASFSFNSSTFSSIAVDMSDIVPVGHPKTFYAASSIEDGKEYVIVSNGMALKNNNGTAEAVTVDEVNGNIVISDASLVWTAAKQSSLTEGTYTFTNAGMSFYRISNQGQFSLGIAAAPSPLTKYYVWDYIENHLVHTSQGGSSTNYYWFYYSSNKWTFEYAKSIDSSNQTKIYCSEKPEDEP